MAKSNKDYDSLFTEVMIEISEQGKSAIAALKGKMSTQKFYELLENEANAKRYARACEMRAEVMANEILFISDNIGNDMVTLADGREVVDNAVVQRDRLRVDSRKWLLSKLQPKKYGDKLDVEHSGNITLQFPKELENV